ncbi:hypothetical protein [Streptomyces sp. RLB3-6]|uniref:hypothetical protein n=1 Tax=Streptomyces sp. RLB3-6 TaxID=2594457 RepID=UPI001161D1EC|nr:hypothetical protein [Streptomyces sp. RLB3-6]QDN84356.1 hypothetical protein FNV61_00060 [Streptomyces sp. RLB3-6]
MKLPAKLAALVARRQGKVRAYETTEDVTRLLDGQVDRLRLERTYFHLARAASLSSTLAYQPGLVEMRGEIYDGAVYLEALATVAMSLGESTLAGELAEASELAHELTARLAAATHATVPAPAVPAIDAV